VVGGSWCSRDKTCVGF